MAEKESFSAFLAKHALGDIACWHIGCRPWAGVASLLTLDGEVRIGFSGFLQFLLVLLSLPEYLFLLPTAMHLLHGYALFSLGEGFIALLFGYLLSR